MLLGGGMGWECVCDRFETLASAFAGSGVEAGGMVGRQAVEGSTSIGPDGITPGVVGSASICATDGGSTSMGTVGCELICAF